MREGSDIYSISTTPITKTDEALAPLLLFVIVVLGILRYFQSKSLYHFCLYMISGLIRPIQENGIWSITVEFHFYLVLPLLLYLLHKSKYSLWIIVCCAILFRLYLHQEFGQLQYLAYWTIVGRIDQFLLGMIAYQMRDYIKGRHFLVLAGFTAFSIFYWYFDRAGGFYNNPSYPSNRLVWVYLPTFEGLAYASVIAWYDNSFVHSHGRVSRFIALIGTYSYSIYLLHFLLYKILLFLMIRYMMPVSNFYIAFCYSVLGFLMMVPFAALSFRFIESPFLKLRTKYLIEDQAESVIENSQKAEQTA